MPENYWFDRWVLYVTTIILVVFGLISLNLFGFRGLLVSYSISSQFQAINVIAVVVTLLSGLLALYGFYYFFLNAIQIPLLKKTPYIIGRNLLDKERFDTVSTRKLVFYMHQELLKEGVIGNSFSYTCQKTNFGSKLVLRDDVNNAFLNAFNRSLSSTTLLLSLKLLEDLICRCKEYITLDDVYTYQLIFLISIKYRPTSIEFNFVYQYLVSMVDPISQLCGDGLNQGQVNCIREFWYKVLPANMMQIILENIDDETLTSKQLYYLIKNHLIGENNEKPN